MPLMEDWDGRVLPSPSPFSGALSGPSRRVSWAVSYLHRGRGETVDG